MKISRKSLLIAAGGSALALSGMIGLSATHAASASTSPTSSLVQMIAQRFNLNPTDVQAVFDQQKTAKQAEHAAKIKTQLDAAVKAGTLTQAQEDLILNKAKEVQDFMNTLKTKTPAERKTALQTEKTQLQQWATDNKIPQQFLHDLGGRFGHGKHDQAEDTKATNTNASGVQ